MPNPEHTSFDEVLGFLGNAQAYGDGPVPVERVDTHAAVVFLAGEDAYKLKRPVKLPYLDFSTLSRREQVLRHELQLNRPQAPQIYRDVVPITRRADGRLRIGGRGEVVEWALHMRRFAQEHLLANYAARHGLAPSLVAKLAHVVFRSHEAAPVHATRRGAERAARVARQVGQAFAAAPDLIPVPLRQRFADHLERARAAAARSLDMRAERGFVRRCHGDLHLANIALIGGQPVLFDALEFDEDLATIDVLYDLAFLLMDMMQHGFRPAAQLLLNRYVQLSDTPMTLYGLSALPLFLALRAAVRAVVIIDRLRQLPAAQRGPAQQQLVGLVTAAIGYLTPPPAKLIAVGGLSGTGKSTLAAALAYQIGAAPGALHLRSDVERKAMFGVGEHERLQPHAYTEAASAEVYGSLAQKAKIALRGGHSVVVDAVYARPDERAAIGRVAQSLKLPFIGLWLTAPPEKMKDRVQQRTGDASDATPEVVERQLTYGTGPISWAPVDASGSVEDTLREARRLLSRRLGALA
ncbi:AAA family ATPase [Rhodoligotrophos defluvii]|uniref:bifunctional aminoglycoside phosphotransferase/ATP-binding protein n=1 Tax=Rhodoligotrophos defluvii TaxID=2561934 RepID=UPI0010C99EA3|nr:bifunctional aminoglycoside phosphotransferase/ATP-binding protein [Rhodoligotrophos defluvii]